MPSGSRRCRVEIEDTGIGIEPEILPHIFGAFEQGNRTITQLFSGLGLGLAISRANIDGHGGTITAASAGVDRGALFTFRPSCLRPPNPPSRYHCRNHRGPGPPPAGSRPARISRPSRIMPTRPICLVVSDLGLPDGTGHDLMRKLAQSHRLRGIALNGFGMEDDVRRAAEAGFAWHLTESVDFDALLASIRELLAADVAMASGVEPLRSH